MNRIEDVFNLNPMQKEQIRGLKDRLEAAATEVDDDGGNCDRTHCHSHRRMHVINPRSFDLTCAMSKIQLDCIFAMNDDLELHDEFKIDNEI